MSDTGPVRYPAVAGQFYPAKADVLRRDVESYLATTSEKKQGALGCVVPHAGYMYSGYVAGAVYANLEMPRRFVILCPNHSGAGEPLAIMSEGVWLTPFGEARIDGEFAAELKAAFQYLE